MGQCLEARNGLSTGDEPLLLLMTQMTEAGCCSKIHKLCRGKPLYQRLVSIVQQYRDGEAIYVCGHVSITVKLTQHACNGDHWSDVYGMALF